jgi:16S rRNA (cytosine967-C5)-methyltransferase
MTESDARRVAAGVLLAVAGGAWSDEALAHALDRTRLEEQDRALATLLVYGTLARQRTLDRTIEALADRPLERIDDIVLIALRLGLFQMGFLDRIPDHAAISTSVDLVARRAASAKGFVNALLRRAQRHGLTPPPDAPEVERLGVLHSHPDWLVRMWIDELPGGAGEAERLLEANNEAAPTCYRVLGSRQNALAALQGRGIDAQTGRFASGSLLIAGPVRRLDGVAVVQGEASQLIVEMLDPKPGERVLDACAAPGGKTAAIASRVGAGGAVVACDPGRDSEARIRTTLRAGGIGGVGDSLRIHARGVESLDPALGPFDAVLVDAPCSGLGTLRQHPEIRWRRTPRDLDELSAKQRRILDEAARRVRSGGRLVYSTCTIARIENDEVIEAFLASHPDFSRDGVEALPDGMARLCDAGGTLRTYPHRDGLDGFFAVRLRRGAS